MSLTSSRVTNAYTTLLCVIAAGMPNLNILMSIGGLLLSALWLYSPGLVEGWKKFRKNKVAILLAGLYLLHILWLLNTSDFDYALKDMKIKLPLLIFPLIIGSVDFSERQLKIVFLALTTGVLVAIAHGTIYYFLHSDQVINFRDIVRGVSHIRFSLMAVLVYASIFYYFKELSIFFKMASILVIAAILIFFNFIQSATGFLVFVSVTLFFFAWLLRRRRWLLVAYASSLMVLALFTFFKISNSYQRYFTVREESLTLSDTTALGNPYTHNLEAGYVENGQYIFRQICDEELIAAWNERSKVKSSTNDSIRPSVYPLLIRYLTSLHLPKDRSGVYALSEKDISNIEEGYPSINYVEKDGLDLRLHTLLFGYHQYSISGNASGLSFFQRIVYWKAALYLISENFIFGTGSGDIKRAFETVYSEQDFSLEPQYRHRAHNQFLTFFVSFGLLGFLYFLSLFAYPLTFAGNRNFIFMAFLLIAFISCLAEDTLETQAGVTFFAFFFCLLCFRSPVSSQKP